MIANNKYEALSKYLQKLGKAAVAFSGGVDSTFLLAVGKEALGNNIVAITIDTPALPRYELEDAVKLATSIGVMHIILNSDEIEPEVKANPVDRCYFCKKIEFGKVVDKAAGMGIQYVLDGTNADDLKDYRPGMKAKEEVNVISPLLENGITKAEIREFSRQLGLSTWDKPAYACLFSRIPYGQEIKIKDLVKIEKAEKFFITKGYKTVRVRCHDNLARIEVDPADRAKLLQEPFATEIYAALKSFGFTYITVDVAGYRMGSLNENLMA
jgi:uncharacterized protein